MDVKLLCGALREAASRLSESGDAASPAPPRQPFLVLPADRLRAARVSLGGVGTDLATFSKCGNENCELQAVLSRQVV
ncbi:hypothetical protein GN244_ATG05365 [Phytophthora infestans]|uniref:Uncharacterized protein n=1 Tax=Phytophthora infestans TaxID=4787 RepID=A0A833SMY3_PHYIN|nr:hypothetical protein GN244_ATG17635 [Phytophthora infestans]KAF4042350.1 hypothetical protein GN244_ATG05365 [Phytophthora infestans]